MQASLGGFYFTKENEYIYPYSCYGNNKRNIFGFSAVNMACFEGWPFTKSYNK